jgi:nucleoid DNA-binding protein
VEVIFKSLLKVIAEKLAKGEPVDIDGLGVFHVKSHRGRFERDLLTMEFYEVEENEIEFLPSPELLLEINFSSDIS